MAANLALIAAICCWLHVSVKDLPRYAYSIDDWKSEHTVYENNGFSPDVTMLDSGKQSELLWGPYQPLRKGSYTAIIDYSADSDQSCQATAAGGLAQLFDSSAGLLSHHYHSVNYQFEVLDDVDEFQLVLYYSGIGNYTVHSVSIVANNNQAKRTAAELLFVLFCIDLILYLCVQERKQLQTLAMLLGICAVVSIPLAMKGINNGADLGVHYLRIEAILQALRSKQFPARISSVTLYGLGYPFSIYYNDIFLYFPAVLRLLGFSVNTAYKIYLFTINAATVGLAYVSFREIFKKRSVGLILALLYASASYRMLNIWIRGAVGEYTAQTFLPVIALALYRIYTENDRSFTSLFKNAVLLAAGMTGIIGSHLLTTIMTCFVTALAAIFFWKKTLRGLTLLTLGLAAVLTLALNLYFLVPFADSYLHEPTVIRSRVGSDTELIQEYGAYPLQYINVFQDLDGEAFYPVEGRLQCTPGLALMVVFFTGIFLRFSRRCPVFFRFSLFFSFLMLFIASDMFPWNWLMIHIPFWKLLTSIQFPWRFLEFAVLMLTILAGNILSDEQMTHLFKPGLLIMALLMTVWFCSDLSNHSKTIYIYDTSGVRSTRTGLEYLLKGSDREKITAQPEGENMETAETVFRNSNTLKIRCIAGTGEGKHTVTVPLYNYRGYHAADESGNELEILNGDQNRIMFELPDGFDGMVTIAYQDSASWSMALLVSALCCGLLIIWILIITKGKRKVSA